MHVLWTVFLITEKYIQVKRMSISIRDDRIVLLCIKCDTKLVTEIGKKGWIDCMVPIISFALKILLSCHGTHLYSARHFLNFTIPGWWHLSAVHL